MICIRGELLIMLNCIVLLPLDKAAGGMVTETVAVSRGGMEAGYSAVTPSGSENTARISRGAVREKFFNWKEA